MEYATERSSARAAAATPAPAAPSEPGVFGSSPPSDFDARWHHVQLTFVDDPHAAVAGAEALLEEAEQCFVEALRAQRARIAQRTSGDDASTEELRTCMQAYRTLLRRMLDG